MSTDHEQPPRKLSSTVTVPAQLLADAPRFSWEPLSAEQIAEIRDRQRQAEAIAVQHHGQLLERAVLRGDRTATETLRLHRPAQGRCEGDEFEGSDGEPPEWPCQTARLIGRLLG